MTSYVKEDNVFTRSGLGKGPSEGIVDKKIGRGQTLKSAYPMNNVSYEMSDERGGSFGGGPTSLHASLKGASAVQDQVGGHKSRMGEGD